MYFTSNDYVVVNMVSRNKDNKDIAGFKPRALVKFCSYNSEKIANWFKEFVNAGVDGEISRLYISINARNTDRTKKLLLYKLIDNDEFNFDKMDNLIVSCASQPECALTKRWLFDFDYNDDVNLQEFIHDLTKIDSELQFQVDKTPNGYAVVTEHGFDTRELLNKWGEFVTLKKDAYLCWDWKRKEMN